MAPSARRPIVGALRWLIFPALVLGAGTLSAQSPTGKVEGRVHDEGGQPISNAQVYIVGTAFYAISDPRGYYFINNIPAGSVAIRSVFIGFHPLEVRDLRVLAGQTVTQDFDLEASPIELQEITVVAAANILVPRDEVTTKQRIDGDFTRQLPVDQVGDVLALQPGVVAGAGSKPSLSIRGGRPEEAVTYVDGVPVTGVSVGTNALEQASVTTGASSAEFGNFQSGIFSIQTRGGGTRYRGALAYETDQPFGVDHSIGFNRLEASFGGPIANRLTFFLSGVLQGQASQESGFDAIHAPVFVSAGIDTTVAVPSDTGARFSDTTFVNIDKFAIYRGDCTAFENSTNPGIRSNYGLPCQGIRLPASFASSYQLQGKLSYTYGTGSRFSFTLLRSQDQDRGFSYRRLYNPQELGGERNWYNVFVLNWTQNLARSAERALALDSYLSYQQDRRVSGSLTQQSELASRDPLGGFFVRPLRFDFEDFAVDEQLINNILINKPGTRRAPVDLEGSRDPEIDQWRNDAYGLPGWPEAGGPQFATSLYQENRTIGRSSLDWQVDRFNRLKLGGEFTHYDITSYSTGFRFLFSDAYIEHPLQWDVFTEDRLDLGDVVLVGGLRYDWYHSGASRPDSLRISTLPSFDPANPRASFVRDQSHHYLSPHVQVSFPVSDRTNFRFSYAHQVQAPAWGVILTGVNSEFGTGSDLDFGKTIAFEFGIRHAFSDDMVLDLSAYNKDNLSNTALRTVLQFDSRKQADASLLRFTNADFGNSRGIDIRFDRRIGQLFNGTLAYTFQDAKNTGSDPFSNFSRGIANVSQIGGAIGPPPQAINTTASSRPHTVTGQLALNFPDHWHHGTGFGALLQNVGIFTVFRYASGTAFTRCGIAPGNETIFSGQACDQLSGDVNVARLPSYKQLDMRFTKGFILRGLDFTAYLDARNILNFENILSVFSVTNNVVNPADRQLVWASDSASYAQEAMESGVRRSDGSLDLRFGGSAASGCGSWVTADGHPAAPNCVYLIRAEERYGDGDHVFTLAEQRRADDAYYAVVGDVTFRGRGIQNLTGTPRRLRVGLEVSF